jgi:putative endonuclease
MKITNPVAKRGEELAVKYLRGKGYKILDRNFRKGYGEIDIVAIDSAGKEKVLVFVEVKTRTSLKFGSPLEAIAPWKLRPLVRTCQFYKMTHPNMPESLRIDAISIILSGELLTAMEHVKNISGL